MIIGDLITVSTDQNDRTIAIFWRRGEQQTECDLSEKQRDLGLLEPVKGFGFSDCRRGCRSHFFLASTCQAGLFGY